jgi:CRP-like cAMP-binding protein
LAASFLHPEQSMAESLAALVKKLKVANVLDEGDIRAIQNLPTRTRELRPREVILSEGDRPRECCVIGEGFAFTCKMTSSGSRQILSLHIPGDIPDLQNLQLKLMDHDLVTLTPCTLGFVPLEAIRALTRTRPNVAYALWRETLIGTAIFREWVVNVGQRSAHARIAHLLMEIYLQLKAIGRASDDIFDFPITQTELADCVGLSPVHVNRVLQDLRRQGILRVKRSEFQLLKPQELKSIAGFDPSYLHQIPAN